MYVYLGRRGHGPSANARPTLGSDHRARGLGGRNESARYFDHAGHRTPRPCNHRFHPNHVAGHGRQRSGFGQSGARASHELVTFAKRRGVAIILVGHVTKDGQIAGPRVVEHMVDTVLYFEGERGHQFRILRAVKNRFGPADEIGVFEMTSDGLEQVLNPSALFLSERGLSSAGSAVFAGIEGTRPVLTEIQALVAPSPLGTPRRTVVGLDSGRLSTILAVLEARCGIPFAGLDVFLNVAGGMRVTEPAADLAVAAAILSAREDIAIPPETVLFGEISLSGALRPVGQTENRLKEASKLGFSQAIAPKGSKLGATSGMAVRQMGDLTSFVGEIFGAG